MISKKAAKRFVYEKTWLSLREYAGRITSGQIGPKATQKDVTKVKTAMLELADKLESAVQPKEKKDAGQQQDGSSEA